MWGFFMQKMAFLSFIICFSNSLWAEEAYKSSECYQKYASKHQSKIEERERQMSILLYGHPLTANNGQTFYLRPNNYQIDAVDFYEQEIMQAADFDLTVYSNTVRSSFSPPPFLQESYEFVKKEIPTVSYYEIQVALREGFKDGDYCKWYGILKPKKVSKSILKKVEEIRKELAVATGIEINDDDRNLDKVLPSSPIQKDKKQNAQEL